MRAGSRLGRYEVKERLGAGGMGEVYLAHDTRLNRDVALKILPAELANNAELRIRFEREAKVLSQLSHPNICTIFDVGDDYLVMELLDGETLANRIKRGALPIEDVIRYGSEMAEALAAAHSSGIVHRDVKPGNVMLTRSGAKLVDFGIAKTIASRSHDAETQAALTALGAVVGTVLYMSPEQLDGNDADSRSDVFSLGAVLYEMITGRKAFTGASRSQPPEITASTGTAQALLSRVVKRCLALNPDDRWQSAADVAEALRWTLDASVAPTVIVEPLQAQRWPKARVITTAAAALAAVMIAACVWWLAVRHAVRPSTTALTIPVPGGFDDSWVQSLAISPDGSSVAYISGRSHTLFFRRFDSFEATEIAHDAAAPFFSPDSRRIGYYIGRDEPVLEVVSVDGGRPLVLASAVDADGAVWTADGIYRVGRFAEGIVKQSADGGPPTLAIRPDVVPGARALIWPDFIPEANALLFTAWTGQSFDDASIVVRSLSNGQQTVVARGTCARWLPSGWILYGQNGSLMGVPFDPKTLRPTGESKIVLKHVMMGSMNGEAQFAISRGGTLVFAPGDVVSRNRAVVQVDAAGKESPFGLPPRPYGGFEVSPDGKAIAVEGELAQTDLYLIDLGRKDAWKRLSFGGDDYLPTWSRDGRRVYFSSTRRGPAQIYEVDPHSGVEAEVTKSAIPEWVTDVSPDGRMLLATEGSSARRVVEIPLATPAAPVRISPNGQFIEDDATFSPDGNWIAYTSFESGHGDVYLRSSDGATKLLVSSNGGSSPVWSRDGRQIFFLSGRAGDPAIERVSVGTSPVISLGTPRTFYTNPELYRFGLGVDSTSLLVVKTIPRAPVAELRVVTNFLSSR